MINDLILYSIIYTTYLNYNCYNYLNINNNYISII